MPTPYLTFDGTAAEALAFYAEVLDGQLLFSQTFGDSPMSADVPPEFHGRLMHATLQLPSGELMASDTAGPFDGPMRSCALSLPYTDVDKGRAAFEALSAGGQVTMPFAKTFWAAGFGMLTDRFGVAWIVNCDDPES